MAKVFVMIMIYDVVVMMKKFESFKNSRRYALSAMEIVMLNLLQPG